MATLKLALAVLATGCTPLSGFGGDAPPLVTIQLVVTGDFQPLRPPDTLGETPDLHVALVWGDQWLTEPLCILPPESDAMAAVIAAGCRDTFGFVPKRVGANVPIEPGVPTTIELSDLPSADLMIGGVTSRVAYASLVVYDDRDHDGTLDFRSANHSASGGMMGGGMGMPIVTTGRDIAYGASFVTMTSADQRLAYREGTFDETAAFYPRNGCGDPLPAFSIVSAGGFSAASAIAATEAGMLPPEDPTRCSELAPADTTVTIPLQAPATAQELACIERVDDSSARYREPPTMAPDLTNRLTACGKLPSFGGPPSTLIQFAVTGRVGASVTDPMGDQCVGLTHYTLRGCRNDVNCTVPQWDYTATPPTWWPCQATP